MHAYVYIYYRILTIPLLHAFTRRNIMTKSKLHSTSIYGHNKKCVKKEETMLQNDLFTQLEYPSVIHTQQTPYEPVSHEVLILPFLTRLPYHFENDQRPTPFPGLISDSRWSDQAKAVSTEKMYSLQEWTQKRRAASELDTVRVSTPPLRAASEVRILGSSKNTKRKHAFFILKVLCLTLLFLVDLPIEFILLAQNGTYQIVDLIIVLVLYSNVIGITLQRHYHLPVDLLKTTLHLKSIHAKVASTSKVHPSIYAHLSSIHDTTAYLKALTLVHLEKREQSR